MDGRTHTAVGAACGLAAMTICAGGEAVGITVVCEGIVFSVIGALFADVDIKRSKGAKLLSKAIAAVACVCVVTALLLMVKVVRLDSVLNSVRRFGAFLCFLGVGIYASTRPHREFSHSFLAMMLTSLLVFLSFRGMCCVWYFIGYCSHLAIDFLNGKGESLLFPLPGKYCLGLCKADGVVNRVLFYMGTVMAFLCFGGLLIG